MGLIRFLSKSQIEGRTYHPGQVVNFPDHTSDILIAAGTAQRATDPPAANPNSRSASGTAPNNHPGYRTRHFG